MTATIDRRGPSTAPTFGDVRSGLQRTLGSDFDEVWSAICADLSVSTDTTDLSTARFDELLIAISHRNRLCHVLAMSWRIRCTAARKLAELGR